jgi:hypothetical protein
MTMLNALMLALAAAAMATSQATPPSFACRPHALDKAQRQRQQTLLDTVRRRVTSKQDLPNGIGLTFPAEDALFRELAEWVSLERRCCPFLEFALEWKQDDRMSVRLTGQPGIKEAITAEMGISIDR